MSDAIDKEKDIFYAGRGPDEERELRADNERLRHFVRLIELSVDGLNTRAFRQKATTQAALDRIKALCRKAITTNAPPGVDR